MLTILTATPSHGPNHVQWGAFLDSELPIQLPSHPVVPQNQLSHVLYGAWHCPGHTHFFVKKRLSHREAYFRTEPWWLRVPSVPLIHSSHCGRWHSIPWLRGQGYRAHIYRYLPLQGARKRTTIAAQQRETRLITDDTMPSVPEVPFSAHSPPHMAVSPVIRRQFGTHGGTPRTIASS